MMCLISAKLNNQWKLLAFDKFRREAIIRAEEVIK